MCKNDKSEMAQWMSSIYADSEKFLEEVIALEKNLLSLFSSTNSSNIYDCVMRIKEVRVDLQKYKKAHHEMQIDESMGKLFTGLPEIIAKYQFYPEEFLAPFMILERLLKQENTDEVKDLLNVVQSIRAEIQVYIDGMFKREENNNGKS